MKHYNPLCTLLLLALALAVLVPLTGPALYCHASELDSMEITVADGETLIGICERYLEDPAQWPKVAKANNLQNPDFLTPGEKLYIPYELLKGTPLPGRVTFILGVVTVRTKGTSEWVLLHKRDAVEEGSLIKTSENSAVEIVFDDGSSVFLRENTTLGLQKSKSRPDHASVRRLYLEEGAIAAKVVKLPRVDSIFEVETPSAIGGVRGTGFRMKVDEADTTYAEVMEGAVGLSAQGEEVVVGAGMGSVVQKGAAPSQPSALLASPEALDIQAEYRMLPARVTFATVEGASKYRVVVSRDRELKETLMERTIVPGSSIELAEIEDGTYYLAASSLDEMGLEGSASTPVEISIKASGVLPAPVITYPEEIQEIHGLEPIEVRWSTVEGAAGYRITVSGDRGFVRMIVDQAGIRGNSVTLTLDEYGTYFVRARAVAPDGTEGHPSDIRSFIIVPPPPAEASGIPSD